MTKITPKMHDDYNTLIAARTEATADSFYYSDIVAATIKAVAESIGLTVEDLITIKIDQQIDDILAKQNKVMA